MKYKINLRSRECFDCNDLLATAFAMNSDMLYVPKFLYQEYAQQWGALVIPSARKIILDRGGKRFRICLHSYKKRNQKYYFA